MINHNLLIRVFPRQFFPFLMREGQIYFEKIKQNKKNKQKQLSRESINMFPVAFCEAHWLPRHRVSFIKVLFLSPRPAKSVRVRVALRSVVQAWWRQRDSRQSSSVIGPSSISDTKARFRWGAHVSGPAIEHTRPLKTRPIALINSRYICD